MLRLPDRWVWDSWLADDGDEYHLFFLQAPRSTGEEGKRHLHATVGHAISTDLRDWRLLPQALGPGPPGSWEDLAIWTGSMIEHENVWYLLYTGTTMGREGVQQRLGLATSTDLMSWTKHPANPVIELDSRWYELVEPDAWRDPWVFADPHGDGFHTLITARARTGAPDARGVIGHAWSGDLVEWEVRPPLSEPGEFGHLEVPQVEIVEGTPVLLFSVAADRFSVARRARLPGEPPGEPPVELPRELSGEPPGSFIATGRSLLGPWDIVGAQAFPVPDLYSARLVRDRAGEWQVLGFYDGSDRGEFIGEISDPIPLAGLGLL